MDREPRIDTKFNFTTKLQRKVLRYVKKSRKENIVVGRHKEKYQRRCKHDARAHAKFYSQEKLYSMHIAYFDIIKRVI